MRLAGLPAKVSVAELRRQYDTIGAPPEPITHASARRDLEPTYPRRRELAEDFDACARVDRRRVNGDAFHGYLPP